MFFCSNCGTALDDGAKFCRNCGAQVAEACSAQPQESVAPAVIEPASQAHNQPVVSGKTKALGFVGMGLSIGGLFFAVFGLLYTFIFMATIPIASFVYAIVFSLFSLPLCIVGGVLCNKSVEQGNRSAVCSVGSKLRIAGIIVSAVMLFFGMIALISFS